jgi:phosphohistidine swiveling domain-containing protein
VKGLPAGPGGAVGKIVFTSEDSMALSAKGIANILVREETNPEDVEGMRSADGILTSRGGMTSHAALVCRGWGKCCIVGAGELVIDEDAKTVSAGGYTFKEGDVISLNGSKGYAYAGAVSNEDETLKSTVEVYDETGTELWYTLTNGTPQSFLTAWAGYGRWALNAQDDRKDWVWRDEDGEIINQDGNEGDVSASYMPAGKYVIKWKIGYVVNRNANWATTNDDKSIVSTREQGATCMYFGRKDVKPSPHVLYTSDKKDAVLIICKTGEAILTVD